jgi:hypothetical protein
MLLSLPDHVHFGFLNQLAFWSAWLWGCTGARKDVEFGLAIDAGELTQADADVLIEHYLTAATPALMLTADERARMKVQLEEAASRAAINPSTETFSRSVCIPMGEGGAGGEGGLGGAAGAANAGSGGEISAGGTGG